MKICRIATLICVLALKLTGQADDYTLITQTLDQGGGRTQSSDYELISSVTADPVSPVVASADYTIYSGFIGQLVNTPPKPTPDVAILGADGTVTVDVLLNDTDDEYQPLVVTGAGPATGGTVSVINGRNVRYVPGANFAGSEIISYTVQDGDGATATSTLTDTVTDTDTDGDGIQDWWETVNGLNPNSAADAALDNDGDGMTNLQEFLAGTNPNDPYSKFSVTITTADPGPGYTLTFAAQLYKTYSIQCKDTLSDASWTTLQSYPAATSQQTITYTDTTGTSSRFYRIVTP